MIGFLHTRKARLLLGLGLIVIVVGIIVVVLFTTLYKSKNTIIDPDEPPGPSDSMMGTYQVAAVATNGMLCAPIGKKVLKDGGNAVDAAIATVLCEGVLNIQSMGIGGGFLMTIYTPGKGVSVLNARETAPKGATKDMFHGDPNLSQRGGLSIAIPGEIRGLEEAYNKFGSKKVLWEDLFKPTIEICRKGYEMTAYVANTLKKYEADILANPELRKILVNNETNQIYAPGSKIYRLKLADTLEEIARYGANAFYNGSLTDDIVNDIQNAGGIITQEDLNNYKVQWQKPVQVPFRNNTFYSVPLPGSGAIVAFILNVLDEILPASDNVTTTQRIIETFKFAYGKRTELGDESDPSFVPNITHIEEVMKNLTSRDYAKEIIQLIHDDKTSQDPTYYGAVYEQPEDHGTAHMSIIGPAGDAVSVTSTINLVLGSFVMSPNTGVLFNNEMDDFSAPNITNAFNIPPSPANFIYPGKRPMSSMCPSIIVDANGKVRLVVGSAGGSKITTSTALIAMHNIIFNATIKEAIDMPRIHHQLFPMQMDYEYGITRKIVQGMEAIGHVTNRLMTAGSTATGLATFDGKINANYDFRRGGWVEGF